MEGGEARQINQSYIVYKEGPQPSQPRYNLLPRFLIGWPPSKRHPAANNMCAQAKVIAPRLPWQAHVQLAFLQ
jgi:hypothetical protein